MPSVKSNRVLSRNRQIAHLHPVFVDLIHLLDSCGQSPFKRTAKRAGIESRQSLVKRRSTSVCLSSLGIQFLAELRPLAPHKDVRCAAFLLSLVNMCAGMISQLHELF